MQVFDLKGEVRNDLGKKATKAVRREEKVPCVLYGGGENVHFAVLDKDLKKLLYTPKVYLVNLDLDGKSYSAVMRDIQFHPVTDKVLHIDFYQTAESSANAMKALSAIFITQKRSLSEDVPCPHGACSSMNTSRAAVL